MIEGNVFFGVFDDWAEFLEVLGIWLAALATFTASAVALIVANRSVEQKLAVSAQPMTAVYRDLMGSRNEPVFSITATLEMGEYSKSH